MKLIEQMQIIEAIAPVNSQTADNEGDWISMKNHNHLTVVVSKTAGVAGDDLVLQMTKGKSAAGGSPAALEFTKVYQKQGAALNTIAKFTEKTNAGVGGDKSKYSDTDSAENAGLYVVEFDAADLGDGYDWVQVRVPDTGAAGAQLLAAWYILSQPRFTGVVADQPSAIA